MYGEKNSNFWKQWLSPDKAMINFLLELIIIAVNEFIKNAILCHNNYLYLCQIFTNTVYL